MPSFFALDPTNLLEIGNDARVLTTIKIAESSARNGCTPPSRMFRPSQSFVFYRMQRIPSAGSR